MIGMNEINQEMAEQNGTEELAFAKARILQQRYLFTEEELQKIECSERLWVNSLIQGREMKTIHNMECRHGATENVAHKQARALQKMDFCGNLAQAQLISCPY